MLKPIFSLSGPNRRVKFLSEDGETISHVQTGTRVYKFSDIASVDSSVETETGAAVTLTLANDTVYQCTNEAITSVTISGVEEGFKCAVIIFNSPSTAAAFSIPETGYYCSGDDCSEGAFTPKADMRYNLYVSKEYDRIAVYVAEAL